MAKSWSRRHVLGVVGTVAVAGCLDANDPTGSTDEAEQQTVADGAQNDNETETDDGMDGNESTDEGDDELHEDYETTEVTATTPDGEELASVTAAIAETDEQLVRGLSETEELPDDRGMLFVYEEEDDRQFVMRDMDFGIDIIYADADGTITGIHHAPEPREREDGSLQYYVGHGQYVLEVTYEWTIEHDVTVGDVLEFDLEDPN